MAFNQDMEKGGVKFDGNKARFSLQSPIALELLAELFTRGAIKYDDHNWRKGMPYTRLLDALYRHLNAFWMGEDDDPETGLPHTVHAMWYCMALTEALFTHPEQDDRFPFAEEAVRRYRDYLGDYRATLPAFVEEVKQKYAKR